MLLNQKNNNNCTARQLKLPLEIEKIIDISDPVYTSCDVQKLLKVILFAFMEHGFSSLRDIEKMCKTDIRFMYLLDDMKAPSFATFGNFIRDELTASVEEIFNDINTYISVIDGLRKVPFKSDIGIIVLLCSFS